MMMEKALPHAITGTLVFLKRLDLFATEKPYYIHVPASAVPGGKCTNEEDDVVEISIEDMRPQRGLFDIDRNGFEVINCPLVLDSTDFSDRVKVETRFLPKIESVVKDRLGATKAWVYDWKV